MQVIMFFSDFVLEYETDLSASKALGGVYRDVIITKTFL